MSFQEEIYSISNKYSFQTTKILNREETMKNMQKKGFLYKAILFSTAIVFSYSLLNSVVVSKYTGISEFGSIAYAKSKEEKAAEKAERKRRGDAARGNRRAAGACDACCALGRGPRPGVRRPRRGRRPGPRRAPRCPTGA